MSNSEEFKKSINEMGADALNGGADMEPEEIFDDIQKEMLDYHNSFVMAGRLDVASVVAYCLKIVQKYLDPEKCEKETDK